MWFYAACKLTELGAKTLSLWRILHCIVLVGIVKLWPRPLVTPPDNVSLFAPFPPSLHSCGLSSFSIFFPLGTAVAAMLQVAQFYQFQRALKEGLKVPEKALHLTIINKQCYENGLFIIDSHVYQ